jgi:hypothetical protein
VAQVSENSKVVSPVFERSIYAAKAMPSRSSISRA